MFLLVIAVQPGIANYESAKLYAVHYDGSDDENTCFYINENVYVSSKSQIWPEGKVTYFITQQGGDWKQLIDCYISEFTQNCAIGNGQNPDYFTREEVLAEDTIKTDNLGYIDSQSTGWQIPDPSQHYRLIAFNESLWTGSKVGSNDSFGCYQEIPEFPFILLPAGIILGFFFWKRK
jgi:hypothetical protein